MGASIGSGLPPAYTITRYSPAAVKRTDTVCKVSVESEEELTVALIRFSGSQELPLMQTATAEAVRFVFAFSCTLLPNKSFERNDTAHCEPATMLLAVEDSIPNTLTTAAPVFHAHRRSHRRFKEHSVQLAHQA